MTAVSGPSWSQRLLNGAGYPCARPGLEPGMTQGVKPTVSHV